MKIDNGIIMLEVSSNVPRMFIHPTVIWDDDNMILVDAGYSGQYDAIKDACINEGIHFEREFLLTSFDNGYDYFSIFSYFTKQFQFL
jgi:hypothetical protein